jgi:hypothetical protein
MTYAHSATSLDGLPEGKKPYAECPSTSGPPPEPAQMEFEQKPRLAWHLKRFRSVSREGLLRLTDLDLSSRAVGQMASSAKRSKLSLDPALARGLPCITEARRETAYRGGAGCSDSKALVAVRST